MPSYVMSNIGNAGLYDPTSGAALASFTKMDTIQFDIDDKMTEQYGGSGTYPILNLLADRKSKIAVNGVEISLGAYYRLLGATNTPAASGSPIQIPLIEDYIIPTSGTVTLKSTPSTVNTIMTVIGILDDKNYTKSASAPTTGEYEITGSTLTFATADAGKSVRVFYDKDATTGGRMQVATNAIPGIYTFKASGGFLQNVDDPAKTAYNLAVIIQSCQMIGTLSIGMERQKATAQKLDVSILDPGPGYDPIDIRTDGAYA